MQNAPFSLLITGDLVIDQDYGISNIHENVINLFEQSDLKIINLEAPLTISNSKIFKTGPHLKGDKQSTLSVLKKLKVDVLTLANNHVLDYDQQGVEETLDFCEQNNFYAVGGGVNLKEAAKTLFIDSKVGKIAIVNFAENEWCSATDENAGANPMDIIQNAKQIKDAKQQADFAFVIVHGGHEYYNLPSPRMQKQYRFYAEQGADIVIGHHTHCINGNETHLGVPIFYSLGNFLFTRPSSYEDWYLGLVLEVVIHNGKLSFQLHPVKQEKETFKLSLVNDDERQMVLNRVYDFNKIIADPILLRDEWNKFINKKYKLYLDYWSPLSFINNKYVKGILRRSGINIVNKNGIALALNLMRCEAHWDISKEVSRIYLMKSK